MKYESDWGVVNTSVTPLVQYIGKKEEEESGNVTGIGGVGRIGVGGARAGGLVVQIKNQKSKMDESINPTIHQSSVARHKEGLETTRAIPGKGSAVVRIA
jgi:hypothetical protein